MGIFDVGIGIAISDIKLKTGHAYVFTLVPFVCDLLANCLDRIDPLSVCLANHVAFPIAGIRSRFILFLYPKSFYASFYASGEKVKSVYGF